MENNSGNRDLTIAYDACLAMLRALRDKHIQLVSRYIIVKSRESRSGTRSLSPRAAPQPARQNIASATSSLSKVASKSYSSDSNTHNTKSTSKKLRGTGGTALIPFLKQARDETGEPAIDAWARRILSNAPRAKEHKVSRRWEKQESTKMGRWRLLDWLVHGPWTIVKVVYATGEGERMILMIHGAFW